MITTALIIILAVETLLILGCLVAERTRPAFISFLLVFVIIHLDFLGFDSPFLSTIAKDIPLALGVFAGYLLVGALYSVPRWALRVRKAAAEMGRIKARHEARTAVLEEKEAAFLDGFEEPIARPRSYVDHFDFKTLKRRTEVRNHKGLITGWIAFWPIDAIVLMFEEPLSRLFEWLAGTYQRITKSALKAHGLDD